MAAGASSAAVAASLGADTSGAFGSAAVAMGAPPTCAYFTVGAGLSDGSDKSSVDLRCMQARKACVLGVCWVASNAAALRLFCGLMSVGSVASRSWTGAGGAVAAAVVCTSGIFCGVA